MRSTRKVHWLCFALPRSWDAIRNNAARFARPTVRSGCLFSCAVDRTSTIASVLSSGLTAKISSSSFPKRIFFPTHRQPRPFKKTRAHRSPLDPIRFRSLLDGVGLLLLLLKSTNSNVRNTVSHCLNFFKTTLSPKRFNKSAFLCIELHPSQHIS